MSAYVDTSALAKLVSVEPETGALRSALDGVVLVTSAVTRTELLRVGLRLGDEQLAQAERLLAGVATVAITRARLERAGRLLPATLRSLDALHLATAIELRDVIATFVGYDDRLLTAATANGLTTSSPA